MTRHQRTWRIRVDFEPNRFSGEYLQKVYEQLKPVAPYTTLDTVNAESATATNPRVTAKRGVR
jgi:hypothetical protein